MYNIEELQEKIKNLKRINKELVEQIHSWENKCFNYSLQVDKIKNDCDKKLENMENKIKEIEIQNKQLRDNVVGKEFIL